MLCYSFHTSKITGTHQEHLLFFIELKMLLFNHDFKKQKTAEPSTCPASITTTPTTQKEKEATEFMGHVLDTAERRGGCYRTFLDELISTDIPGYRNFTRMEPAFFLFDWRRIASHLRKSITNFKKPLEVGLKLAVTLRHLFTGESYTSLQYHWRVEERPSANFFPRSAKPF